MASLMIIWNKFTIGNAASTSDNDQVKVGGKDYVKLVWTVCVCVATMIK